MLFFTGYSCRWQLIYVKDRKSDAEKDGDAFETEGQVTLDDDEPPFDSSSKHLYHLLKTEVPELRSGTIMNGASPDMAFRTIG